ncbi:ras-related protein Rap-2b-like [Panulirus ornatus]|uniref:ras-related protein Rap-2b-like n=1 Tax=Panulirus ornatus TaxID=150431 RepID=UPI003A87C2DC
MKENKLVILGAGGVGKTSLVLQFLQGFFSPTYKPTVEDCYSHTLQLPNGLFHSLEILDTSGTHYFPAMRELSIRSGRAFIIAFAVNNEQTFYEAHALWNLITEVKGVENVPCVLVGNKVDLAGERQVSWDEANALASEANAVYLETSAKYNLNVGLVFKQLLVLTFGLGKDEKKERRPSRIRISLSDLSLTSRRKSSTASRTGSALSDEAADDDTNPSSNSTPTQSGGSGEVVRGSSYKREKCVIL